MSEPKIAEAHSHGYGAADIVALPASGAVVTLGSDGVALARPEEAGARIENDKGSAFTCAVLDPSSGMVALGDDAAFVKVERRGVCVHWRARAWQPRFAGPVAIFMLTEMYCRCTKLKAENSNRLPPGSHFQCVASRTAQMEPLWQRLATVKASSS